MIVAAMLSAATPTAAAAPAPEAKPAKAKKICRKIEMDTSSRLNKKTCKTAEEWEAGRGATADDLQRISRPVGS